MGEENKEEEKKEETKEVKKEEEPQEIVLKVDMHCEACARKVARALKGFEGVEEVTADSKASRVVVKGKTADPTKVCERLQKKSGRKVEIISPLPKSPAENKEEEPKEEKKEEPAPPPTPTTVVLQISMHCEACARRLRKRIRKIDGVESVETNLAASQVMVKGVVDPTKLVDDVYKKTKRQASIIKNEEKKEEEKKEEKKEEEKKEGGEQQEMAEEGDVTKFDMKRSEFWPSKYNLEYYAYPAPQFFSDENPNACYVM